MTLPTANRVELYRVDPDLEDIIVGDGTRGATFEAIAKLTHWVRGRGRCIVPAHHPRFTIAAAASSTLRYFTGVSEAAIARVWLVDVRASTKTASCRFTIQAGAGAASDPIVMDGRSANSRTILYIEPEAPQVGGATEVSVVVAVASGTARVEAVACYELPRAALDRDLGPDFGIALDSYYPREDVWQQSTSGLYGLASAVVAIENRRIGHLAMWHETGFDTTSGAFVALHPAARLVASQDRPSSTRRSLEGYVWAVCSNGTTSGEFDFRRADTTASTAVAIPLLTTVGAWFGPVTLDFGCEDLSEDDGTPGGSYDTCQFRFRRTAGAGTVKIKGYCASEPLV
jgi:hypothetical protein